MTEMEHLVSSMGENIVCTVIQCMLKNNYIATLTLYWIHHKFLDVNFLCKIRSYTLHKAICKNTRSVLAS